MKTNKQPSEPNKSDEAPKGTDLVGLDELSHEELIALVVQLQGERDEARLAAQGWRSLIDIAEQSLNIEIVKKSVAKPSTK